MLRQPPYTERIGWSACCCNNIKTQSKKSILKKVWQILKQFGKFWSSSHLFQLLKVAFGQRNLKLIVKNWNHVVCTTLTWKSSNNIKPRAKPQDDEVSTPDKLDSTLSRRRKNHFFLETDRYRSQSLIVCKCVERRIRSFVVIAFKAACDTMTTSVL